MKVRPCVGTLTQYLPRLQLIMSQDVVTVAVVIEMHACVGRDKHLSFIMLLAIPTEASAHMCSGLKKISKRNLADIGMDQ